MGCKESAFKVTPANTNITTNLGEKARVSRRRDVRFHCPRSGLCTNSDFRLGRVMNSTSIRMSRHQVSRMSLQARSHATLPRVLLMT